MSVRCEQGAGQREVTRPSGWRLVMGADVLNCLETLATERPQPKNGTECCRRINHMEV